MSEDSPAGDGQAGEPFSQLAPRAPVRCSLPAVRSTPPAVRWSKRDILLLALLAAVALWRIGSAIATTEFHRDEARWLHNGGLLRQWRHPLSDAWQDAGYPDVYGTIDERHRRSDQPPFAAYVLGLGVLLQTGHLPDNGFWIMTHGERWNAQHGNMPSETVLRAGRRTDMLVALLTVTALYAAGRLLTNRAGGVATALVFALHPLVRSTDSRAWSDPLLALLIVLAALAAYRLLERPSRGRALALGILLGMGGSTKLSPLLVAGVLGVAGLALLVWPLLRRRRPAGWSRALGFGLLAAPAVAWLTFVALYPYLWTDPAGHTRALFAFRLESFDAQASVSAAGEVASRADALRRAGQELGEGASVGGWLAEAAGLGGHAALANLDLALAVIGWLLLIATGIRRGPRWPGWGLAGVIALQSGGVIAGLRVEYARYFLPVLLAVALGIGVLTGVLWETAGATRRSRPVCPKVGYSTSFP